MKYVIKCISYVVFLYFFKESVDIFISVFEYVIKNKIILHMVCLIKYILIENYHFIPS